MNPLVDSILVAAVVFGALAFFARRALHRPKSCNSGCGCDVAKKAVRR